MDSKTYLTDEIIVLNLYVTYSFLDGSLQVWTCRCQEGSMGSWLSLFPLPSLPIHPVAVYTHYPSSHLASLAVIHATLPTVSHVPIPTLYALKET